jgi:4-amino-4-deoxy-L-arabinose transferase-like glycosyltransferase
MPVLSAIRRHRVLCIVLTLHALAFVLIDTVISPHPDYIDHWMQSRVMEWGYYEHPPMIAWLLRALTSIVGDSEWALEGIAIFLNLLILFGMYAVGASVFGIRAAAFGLIAADTTPFFIGGTPLVHIDQPLLLFWLAALWTLLRYQKTGNRRWLLAMGVLAGLGALSKYTMVLFYLSALAFILGVKERRRELLNPYVYAAGVLSLLVFSPVLIWNAQHDWVSILFQLKKGAGGQAEIPGKHLLEFTLGWVMLFSPVMVAAGFIWLWRRWRTEGLPDTGATLLLAQWITPVAFFSLAMIPGSFPDPQYVNVGFVSFFMLLGREIEQRWATQRRAMLRLYLGSGAITATLLVIVGIHTYRPFLSVSPGGDFTRQIVGWHEMGEQVSELLREKGIPEPEYVLSFYYPLATQFSLHLPSRPYTYSLQREARNEWADKSKITPANSIIVCEHEHDDCLWMHDLVHDRFGRQTEVLGTVTSFLWGRPRHTVTVMRMLP